MVASASLDPANFYSSSEAAVVSETQLRSHPLIADCFEQALHTGQAYRNR